MTTDVINDQPMETCLPQPQPPKRIAYSNAGAAHDLIGYLSIVDSYVALLQMDARPGDPMVPTLAETARVVDRCLSLARHLLCFSRVEGHHLRMLCLNDIVATMADTLRVVAGQDVELIVACAPDAGLVWTDPQEIERVLLNLVINARQALPAAGTIALRVANAQVNEVEAFAGDATAYVTISVSDTGTGMDEETYARCLEPSFTTRREGRGLGLAIVHDIAARNHGHVQVESELGHGTTFRIYLPRIDTDETERREHYGREPQGSAGR